MELDYDIYSYLARGIGNGTLELQLVREKVTYEIIDIDTINLNDKNNDSIRYKLKLLDENGKQILNEDGNPIIYYETAESLKKNYIKIAGKKNNLKKIQECIIAVNVPKDIKVPLDKLTSKLYTIEKGKWIDITNLEELKFYSDKKFNILFDRIEEESKKMKRVSI